MSQPQPAAFMAAGRDDRQPFPQSHVTAKHAVLIQSRGTGEVVVEDTPVGEVKALPFAQSWVHLMAGA